MIWIVQTSMLNQSTYRMTESGTMALLTVVNQALDYNITLRRDALIELRDRISRALGD